MKNQFIHFCSITLLCMGLFQTKAQCPTAFFESWESGVFASPWSLGSGHSVTVSLSSPASGLYAMYMSGSSGHTAGPNATFTPSQPNYVAWYVQTNNVSAANAYFVLGDANVSSNLGIVFCYLGSSSLGSMMNFYNGSTYSYSITANTWYHVELKNINWTTKSFDIWINGSLWQTNFAFRSTASVNVSVLHLYNLNSATSGYDRIEMYSAPTISVTSTPTSACAGNTVALTASGTASTYTWTGSVSNGVPFTPSATTVYTVTGYTGTGTNICAATMPYTLTVNPNPTLTIASPNVSVCLGSGVALSAGGASTYTWSNGSVGSQIVVSPATNTVYTVVGTSAAGCTGPANNATINVSVLPSPVLTLVASSNTICVGQSATLTVSGASTYTWAGGPQGSVSIVSPQSTGYFGVTGTNTVGCSATIITSVIVNPVPVLSITSSSAVVCENDPVTFTVSGALTFTWNNGANTSVSTQTVNSAGTYTVSGTNGYGCSSTAAAALNVMPGPTMAIIPSATAVCLGSAVSLTATGAPAVVWNSGLQFSSISATPVAVTQYSVVGTEANGCKGSAIISISVNPVPTVSVKGVSVICKGEKAVLTATGATSYTWSNTENTPSISVSPVFLTNFTVTGSNQFGCTSKAVAQVSVSTCNGIVSNGDVEPTLSLYPNPSAGNINVRVHSSGKLEILSMSGASVRKLWVMGGEPNSIDLSDLANGIYIISLNDGYNIKTVKLVLQR